MMSARPVLVVDDEVAMRVALSESLRALGYDTQVASSAEEALTQCEGRPVAAVIADMKMQGMSGLDLFHEMQRRQIQVPVVLMSAYGTIETAISAMRSGVIDYLPKPFSQEALGEVLHRALPHQSALQRESTRGAGESRVFLTQDPITLALLKTARHVASGQASILIEGESGTGKERMARLIHAWSPRAHRPFVAINCAAIPDTLLESELFGYEKGAFTGAVTRKPGRFEMAHTGTILLDEISELSPHAQAKLLRVLQEREIDPLGGRTGVPLDIRVISTSNRPLGGEVQAGRFRQDLYYRVNIFPLKVPPLRERRSDIEMLLQHFACQSARRNGRPTPKISEAAIAEFLTYDWPGNVRELENRVERAILLLQDGDALGPEHFPRDEARPASSAVSALWETERTLILRTLARHQDNRTHAARDLGISVRTLRSRLKEYSNLSTEPVDGAS